MDIIENKELGEYLHVLIQRNHEYRKMFLTYF
jgi:hypothetical protein